MEIVERCVQEYRYDYIEDPLHCQLPTRVTSAHDCRVAELMRWRAMSPNTFIVDLGRGWTPAYLWCRRAVTCFSLLVLQQLLLLLLAATAAGCLLTSTESCCRWQSALYLAFLKLLICPDIIAVSQG
eukprot:COSAG01_NODE_10893_length_2058_cov_6.530883_1_plen_127_part_00